MVKVKLTKKKLNKRNLAWFEGIDRGLALRRICTKKDVTVVKVRLSTRRT